MSNTNKMRVELLTVGETEDEKWVEHLKFEAPVGHSLSMGRNGSLMRKRYKTREKDLGLSLGDVNRPQKSRSLTTVKAVGERFNEQG